MINVDVRYSGSSVLVSADGELNGDGGEALQRVLGHITFDERHLLVDLQGVVAMNTEGLLHLLGQFVDFITPLAPLRHPLPHGSVRPTAAGHRAGSPTRSGRKPAGA
ncbi:hypothetical protein AB0P15_36275 [Streptomyces sp. NPDC087917]|uniref:hypothetical protein n=1 Tax=Streptomyces sp. NPDC087917 TaxID=3155060 RepID=UPI0034180B5E